MLLSILSTLLEKTKYLLTKIRRIFPAESSPNEGVTSLVTLFKLTLESARQLKAEFPSVFTKLPQAQQFARNLAAAPACDLLASYVEVHYNKKANVSLKKERKCYNLVILVFQVLNNLECFSIECHKTKVNVINYMYFNDQSKQM